MPRKSAEARAGAVWRSGGGKHPEPPASMTKEEKDLWRSITRVRPVDFFSPGSLTLLAQFVTAAVTQDYTRERLAENREDDVLIRRMKDLAAIINSTAIKLRISVQAEIDRKSGALDERQPSPKRRAASLLGGIDTIPDISDLN